MRCISIKTNYTKRAVVVIDENGITDYKVIDDSEIRIYSGTKPDELNRLLIKNDVNVSGISESGISLEDYFKSLVGGEK